MSRQYRDESWLRSRYHDDGCTQAEIAEECGVSPRCIRTWMNRFDIETRDVSGENHGLYGQERDDETKRKISESMTGREFTESAKAQIARANRRRSPSEETRERISDALSGRDKSTKTRARMSEASAGEQNPNWRGGYSPRYGPGWSVARERVRERDTVCQSCGEDGSTHQLDVHHIVPVRLFREQNCMELADAHALDNLVLLCKPCHSLAEHGTIEVFSTSCE